MYDLIGDIHGHADELVFLLEQLGYDRRKGGLYSHPQRKAVFLGDLIDRGPKIRETLQIVRGMVESGAALCILGNHEFNALTYHTRHPKEPGRFLRQHDARDGKNVRQHFQTLKQLSAEELYDSLEWFRTLPMWLDLGELRVVHACWDPQAISIIETNWDLSQGLTLEFLIEATHSDSKLFHAVEDVLKGKEVRLPEGVYFHDKDGHRRRNLRVRWYQPPENQTYHTYAFESDEEFPNDPLPPELVKTITPYGPDQPPVFVGHYWLHAEKPMPLASNVACIDFSVAKGGRLCAYRWNGEQQLSPEHFESVPAFPLH